MNNDYSQFDSVSFCAEEADFDNSIDISALVFHDNNNANCKARYHIARINKSSALSLVESIQPFLDKDFLPCPFCGGYAEYYQSSPQACGHGDSSDDVGVRCKSCCVGIMIGNYADHEVIERNAEARKRWNTRIL